MAAIVVLWAAAVKLCRMKLRAIKPRLNAHRPLIKMRLAITAMVALLPAAVAMIAIPMIAAPTKPLAKAAENTDRRIVSYHGSWLGCDGLSVVVSRLRRISRRIHRLGRVGDGSRRRIIRLRRRRVHGLAWCNNNWRCVNHGWWGYEHGSAKVKADSNCKAIGTRLGGCGGGNCRSPCTGEQQQASFAGMVLEQPFESVLHLASTHN